MRRFAWPLLAAALTAATPPPAERVIAPDGREAVTINGVTRTVRIDPGAPGLPIITTRFAEAAGMKPGLFSVTFGVGSEKFDGQTAVVPIRLGSGEPYKRRVAFTERPYDAGFDGVFGPASLADPVIRFRLRDPRPGERTFALPMVGGGGLVGNWKGRFVEIAVDGAPMQVLFAPHRPRSTTNAGGAVRLARSHGGQLAGKAEPLEIVFGVSRPVRTMTLERPLVVGPLSLNRIGVRTVDYGSTATIADADAPGDPDEVVVTGKGKRDPKKDWISLGADQLDRCSSIVFDKPAKQVRMSCL